MADTDPSLSTAHATTATASWYVVHTKPRKEQYAREQLERQDFEVYLPLFKVFKTSGRRAEHTVVEPMFPRYLFLRPTRETQSLSVVRSTLGVTRLVMFGHQPATLVHAAVDAIRDAEAWRAAATLADMNPYEPGMPVRLRDGALANVQAMVHSISGDRVTLLLEILGRPQKVQVEMTRIEPV